MKMFVFNVMSKKKKNCPGQARIFYCKAQGTKMLRNCLPSGCGALEFDGQILGLISEFALFLVICRTPLGTPKQ